jgi:hypothetical protein
MLLSQKLLAEINESTNVQMFIDESANIFWVSKEGRYIWMMQDSSYLAYIDENHIEVNEKSPEGAGNTGVYWNNEDFNNPFHITDFEKRISTITI